MGRKHCGEKEKLLITSNFSFSHSVFKRLVSQGCQKVLLCGNGLTMGISLTYLTGYSISVDNEAKTKLSSKLAWFLAPLADGQQAIVMALCLSSVRQCMRVCVRKLFLQKNSPQKLLTGFLHNFIGMFLRWSSFKFLQKIVFFEEFWLPWRSK